ncbi:antibiotic biosynthesis monooxygenase [Nocardioides panaciterrulae]|uniref:Quinol monooxygenase YgiN n=1 Tax=Nocardioides panaciterrulae TaxID=661492 RepID=A0A7Y9E712_9ACTN|nr:antibiotic biosynthesis monooxygenase [Nocardioides panaciterrulae]NYD42110.1 quinol monooxygenase YgiN [Nocardioides panaciterrulae]
MFVRSTTIDGDPAAIDAGITHVRDSILPTVTAMDGCLGMALVVDRESGRGIATTAWDSEQSMLATAASVMPMRNRATEIFGGPATVEEWEVAVMHRDHTSTPGACCRITWTSATDMDGVGDMWRSTVLPRVETMEGFCSASFLIDRGRGRTCGTVVFDSREALEGSREAAASIREQAAREADVQFLDVAEFELALAHLRLPELV